MKVEKFPKILFKGKEVLWDSRQNIADPVIVIRKSTEAPVAQALMARSAVVLQEGRDFASFGQWIAEQLGEPSRKLKVVGIVGTSGKTTTAAILRYLLVSEGKRVLEIGTFGAQLWSPHNNEMPRVHEATGFTSPDAPTLQDLLRQAVPLEVDVVVMEVTSHAIALGRVAGVEFDAAIFLNFSQDHLDFHASLDEYKKVKKSFFTDFLPAQPTKKPYVVINANDSVGAEIAAEITVPFEALRRNENYIVDETSLELAIAMEPSLAESIVYPFVGHFLAENLISAAKVAATLLDSPTEKIIQKLRKFPGIPGRMEILHLNYNKGRRNFIVDYAHKPAALEKNLQSLKRGMKRGKLWVLFGCGGDRDSSKRPVMGQIAALYADKIVVTSDNPRREDAAQIIREIVRPLDDSGTVYHSEISRRAAMLYCMENMEDVDLCLVAGRGAEDFQIVGDTKVPFNDSEVLKSLSS